MKVLKVTVCFEGVKVMVPCSDDYMKVKDLMRQASMRYKKVMSKVGDGEEWGFKGWSEFWGVGSKRWCLKGVWVWWVFGGFKGGLRDLGLLKNFNKMYYNNENNVKQNEKV